MAKKDEINELLNSENFRRYLAKKLSEEKSENETVVINEEYLHKLKNRFESLWSEENLKKGDFVVWKDGLKNRRIPNYDQPGIVIDKIEKPIITEDENSGSNRYREPLDLIVGFVIRDDFVSFHYDSRRFKKYQP